ncbi:hypothetical protein [Alkalihalophilus marmarensis]|uniref:hypothetical protein n=1 Tax=Alkalihalophilus marmarensis TaxID=521377 RepID=UPI002DBD5D36|nr:hypothetical protein [Alkalihalophilus marmarensis]MEC2072626.1 hypothetical protein [Alkalihalophilus marmarensis]
MRQASTMKPYSKQLSNHYLNKRKLKNKQVREQALQALEKNQGQADKRIEKAGT